MVFILRIWPFTEFSGEFIKLWVACQTPLIWQDLNSKSVSALWVFCLVFAAFVLLFFPSLGWLCSCSCTARDHLKIWAEWNVYFEATPSVFPRTSPSSDSSCFGSSRCSDFSTQDHSHFLLSGLCSYIAWTGSTFGRLQGKCGFYPF